MNTLRSPEPGSSTPHAGLPPGGQIRRLTLSGAAGTVGRARSFAREALTDWEWFPGRSEEQQAVAEDVLLLVSELVTNACLHAGGPSELALHCTSERLRVEVADASPRPPLPRAPHDATRPGGHGLHIVDRLSLEWGTEQRHTGKAVWLEIAVPA